MMCKKKLLGLMALPMAFTALFGFTACGEDKKGGGNTENEKPPVQNPADNSNGGNIKPPEEFSLTSNNIKYEWNDWDKGYVVMGFAENKTEQTTLVVPDTVNGYPVTDIVCEAFDNCNKLTNISLGNGLKSIGGGAFHNTAFYNNMSNWENGVLYIGKCLITANTTISGTYQIKAETILVADLAFADCKSLTGITIPDSVTGIGLGAFSYCSSLTSVNIPDSVTVIEEDAFYECSSLENISIGDGVESIEDAAFYNTAFYKEESNWENDVLYIGKYLIQANESITGAYEIKSGTKVIGFSAFSGCNGLTSIIIPNSVTCIGCAAFYECSELKSVIIPDSVTRIRAWAFYDCSNMINISIGSGVKRIEEEAFKKCSALLKVYYTGSNADWKNISISGENFEITLAMRYYYIENEADVPTDGGKYWHYVDGTPTAW